MNEARKIDLVINECLQCPYKCRLPEIPGRYCFHENEKIKDTELRALWWIDDNDEYIDEFATEKGIRIPDWCPLQRIDKCV
jgi:hypothetical protein